MFKRKVLKIFIMMMVLVSSMIMTGCDGANQVGNTNNTAIPEFVREGEEYQISTSDAELPRRTVLVKEIRDDGWIIIDRGGRIFWINTAHIVSIEE